ncbi:MAG TPA: Zn-ribbon domain-containing OB-fold protein [Alphaproteobacteria bacterium]|nr:Zn-ribbon domain-containing OB-fold protein [Alphaproteobacteria bacterium]
MTAEHPNAVIEHWDIIYTHDKGPIVTEFYERLAENKILGRHCPKCGRVLLPPRAFCDRDFADTDKWVEVGQKGVIETFTVVFQKFRGLPDPPYCIAYVRLDGADTSILNFVRVPGLVDAEAVRHKLKVGQKVKVVFAPKGERTGRITDFWFEPEV